MQPHTSDVGRCPDCGATVPRGGVLVRYRRADGPAMYAECPACAGVVRPETDGAAEPSYGS